MDMSFHEVKIQMADIQNSSLAPLTLEIKLNNNRNQHYFSDDTFKL